MKPIYKALAAACLAVAGVTMTSCNDDYLEKYPQTSLTEQNAFQTYENFRAYMYNSYALFTNANILTNFSGNSYYWGGQWLSDYWSGLMTNRENGLNPYAWQSFSPVTSANSYSPWSFGEIRRINVMLSHLDDGNLTEAEKRHWRSVGYFFHSWWYMELVNRFGDIPYITTVLTDESEEAYGPRTPRKEVADSIIARLEYAIANLGDISKDGSNPLNADACRAALSRFLLREGTWAKYHKLNEPWEQYLDKCLKISEELMNKYPTLFKGNGYNKYPGAGYDEMLTSESLRGVPGVIMYKEYGELLMHRFSDLIHVEAHRCDGPQHTVDMFLMKNGLPISNPNSGFEGGEGKDLYDYFNNRDPRLIVNFCPPAMGNIVRTADPDNVNTFIKWRFYKVGEQLNGRNNRIVSVEDSIKFRRFIDYLGPNIHCVNGEGDPSWGVKRLPGHNWGGDMSHSSPNITQYSQTDNYMRCWTGYYFWKNFTMWEVGSNGNFQTSDKPIFLIEEVLLNYAEAAFELGRFNQGVADITINKLRDRLDMGHMEVAKIDANFDPDRDKGTAPWTRGYGPETNYEVNPVLWEIRRERMLELMGQGFAFYDIRRWHKAPYYVNRQACGAWVSATDFPYGTGAYTGEFVDYNEVKSKGYATSMGKAPGKGWIYTYASPLASGKGWLDAYYLSMVPTYEITMNPELTQNPGYAELFGNVTEE